MAGTVFPERARVGLVAVYRQVIVRLIRGLQHFLCDSRVDGDGVSEPVS